jgi:hypothetical protein
MLTADIDSGNISLYVYVVNIDWPGRQRNPRWEPYHQRTLEEAPMSRTTHSHPRRALFASAVLLIGLAASGGTAQAQSPRFVRTNDLYSAYVAGFTGLDAAGRDMVWRGAVAGAAVGRLIVRLADEGRVTDATNRTWPVEGIIFVSGENPRRAFAAEVRGTIDWQAKRVTLTGVVSTGYLSSAYIELTADLIDDALHGELRLVPASLAAAW